MYIEQPYVLTVILKKQIGRCTTFLSKQHYMEIDSSYDLDLDNYPVLCC